MATCINLWERFGDRYRITFEEVATVRGRKGDPWLMQISCRLGTIYPHGGDLLALEIDYHDFTAARLRRLGLEVVQDGDREKTLLFGVDRFEEIAAIVQPKKRRRLTLEHRQASIQRLKAY
ncbi:MAG TPA: hypothetical protein VKE98_10705, partial [Gemmataceae bacterium]|nr:hypothetical protein [Gemmataceae bacterium]